MEYKLINIMEDKVLSTTAKAAPELKCCTCPKCRLDIAAYVLNRIPPKYVDTEKGALFTRANHMSSEFDMKILLEVTSAAASIGIIPKHESNSNQTYRLLNVMEDRVFRAINDTLPQLGGCICDRCKADVAAYTLSRIKPHYVTLHKEELYSDIDSADAEYDSEILQIIVEASGIVSAKPNHK